MLAMVSTSLLVRANLIRTGLRNGTCTGWLVGMEHAFRGHSHDPQPNRIAPRLGIMLRCGNNSRLPVTG